MSEAKLFQLLIIAQMGSTIAIGLLLDTLAVRSLLMLSIATLLGRWFWWPQVVYPRGDHNRPQPPTHDTADTDDAADTDALALPAQRVKVCTGKPRQRRAASDASSACLRFQPYWRTAHRQMSDGYSEPISGTV